MRYYSDSMRKVEVETRSLITPAEYARLTKFLKKNAVLVDRDSQVTHYLNDDGSLRVQRNGSSAKLMLKRGRLHSAVHEEFEVRFARGDFGKLGAMLSAMGFPPRTKWFRLRHTFRWKGISVMLDRSRGYGNIIELEKICSPKEKGAAIRLLEARLSELGVKRTPEKEFDRRYAHYRRNWRRLTR